MTSSEELQAWIFACVKLKVPFIDSLREMLRPDDFKWDHEDNVEADREGYVILRPPNCEHLDLFTTTTLCTPVGSWEYVNLISGARTRSTRRARRAVDILNEQQRRFPHVKFLFQGG